MQKNGFTIIEVVVVFLLMLGVVFLVLPKSLNSTKQARLISKWAEKYSELQYTFSVIKAQKDTEIEEKLLKAADDKEKKEILLEAIKPYLRITSEIKVPYKQFYMDGTEVKPGDKYFFDNFYFTKLGEIIGLKLINPKCSKDEPCADMSFDMNGFEKPNTWGYDIFGINVFNGEVEPFGKGIDLDILKKNCSKYGSGIYCSYYYLIGGRFD